MIHRANDGSLPRREVGWGRFEADTVRLLTCEDDEALVVFQGKLPRGYYLRARVPLPSRSLRGNVRISSTILIAPETDPENADAYTRGGLEIHFRPDARRRRKTTDGRTPKHASTRPFFSLKNMYGKGEYELREDGKWEPCRKGTQRLRAASLHLPVFDIYHHVREDTDREEIAYAMVISLQAPKVTDLYDQVLRTFANVLVPLRSQIQIQVRT
jgi:hypothetical protein